MAENSAIEWTDSTWNPWEGCQKVGPGCDHCYAETRNARFGGGTAPNWGPGAPRRRTSAANWRKPLAWQRDAARFMAEHGRRQRVFCASLADVFDNAVVHDWRDDLFHLIDATPDLEWLLLTKRIGNVRSMLDAVGRATLPANVWLGATVVNQVEADRDVPKLLAACAKRRFLSMEPLLGPVDLTRIDCGIFDARGDALTGRWSWTNGPSLIEWPVHLDWIIVGGESGPGARPMHPDWARSLRDQCAAAEVPFLFKQWGKWAPTEQFDLTGDSEYHWDRERYGQSKSDGIVLGRDGNCYSTADAAGAGSAYTRRVGKKAAGRLLDGVQHDGVPS